MDGGGHIIVFVTVGTEAEAAKTRDILLEARQAACVSVLSNVSSAYWWNGRLESATESLLIVKTMRKCLEEVIELVKRTNSNAVPEIIALPIVAGNPEYLTWIDKEVCAK